MAHKGQTIFCDDCDKPFRLKANLRGHIAKQIECPYCQRLNPSPTSGPILAFQIPPTLHDVFYHLREGNRERAKKLVKAQEFARLADPEGARDSAMAVRGEGSLSPCQIYFNGSEYRKVLGEHGGRVTYVARGVTAPRFWEAGPYRTMPSDAFRREFRPLATT